ncbi:hypothetical protein [Limnospira fusiformis]|nr:hypothetical protein SPLC1_S032980 [Arthrospira platensis C1]
MTHKQGGGAIACKLTIRMTPEIVGDTYLSPSRITFTQIGKNFWG